MADIFVPYIKAEDGSLLPVAAIYDKNGNDITETYAKKENVGICIYRNSDGYPCFKDIEE